MQVGQASFKTVMYVNIFWHLNLVVQNFPINEKKNIKRCIHTFALPHHFILGVANEPFLSFFSFVENLFIIVSTVIWDLTPSKSNEPRQSEIDLLR